MEIEYKEGKLGSKSVLECPHFSRSPSYVSAMKHVVKPKHVSLIVTSQVSVVKLQLDPARAFMTALKTLKARSTPLRM